MRCFRTPGALHMPLSLRGDDHSPPTSKTDTFRPCSHQITHHSVAFACALRTLPSVGTTNTKPEVLHLIEVDLLVVSVARQIEKFDRQLAHASNNLI